MTTQTQTTTEAAGAAPATGAGTPPPDSGQAPAAGATAPWFSGFDDETKSFVETKGWKDPANAVGAYRELEKLVGLEKVPLPKDENDKAGWDRLYKAVGRPDTPEGYEVPLPEGDNGEFANGFKQKAHELGLSAKAAQGLAEWWNGQIGAAQQAQTQALEQQTAQARDKLQSEWGAAHDERMALAKQAALRFIPGADSAQKEAFLSKIEATLGTYDTFRFMAEIGMAIREDKMAGLGNVNPATPTPEQADQQIQALMKDPDFSTKYVKGDAEARKKMSNLQRAKLGLPLE